MAPTAPPPKMAGRGVGEVGRFDSCSVFQNN